MMSLFEDTAPAPAAPRQAWFGTIAKNAANPDDRLEVIVPDLVGTAVRITDARWMPRGALDLPVRGDECLVIFDNRQQPWVVAWWPF